MLRSQMLEQIEAIKYLPVHDKEALRDWAEISYGHAQARLRDLSIFCADTTRKTFGNFEYEEINDRVLYFAGMYPNSNLSIFIDESKKILFHSRFYLTHLGSFLSNIDSCLFHLDRLCLQDATYIGCDIVSIEKWFKSYGHFKDEAYSLGSFLLQQPELGNARALLDYPNDSLMDTSSFKFNSNYIKIDNLIFKDRSINAYDYGSRLIMLKNLKLLANGFDSKVFHSFPPFVCERIRGQVIASDTPPGPRRMFLTRSSSYRDIANKFEVEEFFKSIDFAVINPENITYEELVRLASGAEIVAMYYGSAMTNMVYCNEGAEIIILKSGSYLDENLSLWNKVIANYKLRVTVMPAVDNVIRDQDLSAVKQRLSN